MNKITALQTALAARQRTKWKESVWSKTFQLNNRVTLLTENDQTRRFLCRGFMYNYCVQFLHDAARWNSCTHSNMFECSVLQ